MADETMPPSAVPKDIADIQTSIARLTNAQENLVKVVGDFIVEQGKINRTQITDRTQDRGSAGRTWVILGSLAVGSYLAMYAFVMLGVSNQVGPLAATANANNASVNMLGTMVAELKEQNIEFGTQVNCLEIVREFEREVDERDRQLLMLGAIKLPAGVAAPALSYHPFCQPAASVAR